jgi:hypothetical protein
MSEEQEDSRGSELQQGLPKEMSNPAAFSHAPA